MVKKIFQSIFLQVICNSEVGRYADTWLCRCRVVLQDSMECWATKTDCSFLAIKTAWNFLAIKTAWNFLAIKTAWIFLAIKIAWY